MLSKKTGIYFCSRIGLLLMMGYSFSAKSGDITSAGVSLGLPGITNIVVELSTAKNPIRLSAGYLGLSCCKIYGAEAAFLTDYTPGAILRSKQIFFGHTRLIVDGNDDFFDNQSGFLNYAGYSFTFRFGGFFVEPGAAVVLDDNATPELMVNFGWMFD